MLSTGLRLPDSCHHSLPDHLSLVFCHGGEDIAEKAARWGSGVHVGLRSRNDLNSPGQEVLHDGDQVAQTPAQAIEPPHKDAGKAALVSVGQEAGKFWPAGGGTGDASVHVLLANRPPSGGDPGPEFTELDFRVLLGRGASGVEGNWKTWVGR